MKTGSRLQCSNRSSGRKKEAGKTIENRTQPELVPNQASKSNIVRGALVSEPPIAAPDEHAQLVEADQRFRTALGQAIAAGGERIEAVEATVQLKRHTKLPR